MNEDLVTLGKSEGEYEFKANHSMTIKIYDDSKKIIVDLNGSFGITPNSVIAALLQSKHLWDYKIEVNVIHIK